MKIVEKQIKDVPSSSTTFDQEEKNWRHLFIATLGLRIRKQCHLGHCATECNGLGTIQGLFISTRVAFFYYFFTHFRINYFSPSSL